MLFKKTATENLSSTCIRPTLSHPLQWPDHPSKLDSIYSSYLSIFYLTVLEQGQKTINLIFLLWDTVNHKGLSVF